MERQTNETEQYVEGLGEGCCKVERRAIGERPERQIWQTWLNMCYVDVVEYVKWMGLVGYPNNGGNSTK